MKYEELNTVLVQIEFTPIDSLIIFILILGCIEIFQNNLENNIIVGEKIYKFWELEDCSSDNIYTLDGIKCKDHFEKSVIRDIQRRFEVKLPFCDSEV